MDDGKNSATNYKPVGEILKIFNKNFTKFTSDLRTGKEPRVPIKYSLGTYLSESMEFKGGRKQMAS